MLTWKRLEDSGGKFLSFSVRSQLTEYPKRTRLLKQPFLDNMMMACVAVILYKASWCIYFFNKFGTGQYV